MQTPEPNQPTLREAIRPPGDDACLTMQAFVLLAALESLIEQLGPESIFALSLVEKLGQQYELAKTQDHFFAEQLHEVLRFVSGLAGQPLPPSAGRQ